MLNIRIENNEGTYRYYVFVNGKEIERGDYSGHNREDGWAALVLDIALRHLTPRAADGARWQCQKDGFMNRHDLQKCSLCGLPRRLAAQQSEKYCPNCRVALVGDKCGKCCVQWTRA